MFGVNALKTSTRARSVVIVLVQKAFVLVQKAFVLVQKAFVLV